MTDTRFAPRALQELRNAADWIADDNPNAPARYRFWSLRGYPYVLVFDTDTDPPTVARFVHQSRDLPAALGDLEE